MTTLDAELQAAYQALETAETEWAGWSGRGLPPIVADAMRADMTHRLETLARQFAGLSERLGLLGNCARIH